MLIQIKMCSFYYFAMFSQGSTGVKFSDVAGIDEAVEELQEVLSLPPYLHEFFVVCFSKYKDILLSFLLHFSKILKVKGLSTIKCLFKNILLFEAR